MKHRLRPVACVSLMALILLCLLWELWLAPLRPDNLWLAAKAFPLFLILPGLFRGRRYTYQVASLLAMPYLLEGSVRAASDAGLSRWLGLAETLLTLVFFFSVVFYARLNAPARHARTKT
jgi:uncharacterized membrane protein